MSVKDYAKLKGISKATVRRYIKEDKIRAVKIEVRQGSHSKYSYFKYLIEEKIT